MFDSSSLSSRDRSSGTETHDGENTAHLNSHLHTAHIAALTQPEHKMREHRSEPLYPIEYPVSANGVHNQGWKKEKG